MHPTYTSRLQYSRYPERPSLNLALAPHLLLVALTATHPATPQVTMPPPLPMGRRASAIAGGGHASGADDRPPLATPLLPAAAPPPARLSAATPARSSAAGAGRASSSPPPPPPYEAAYSELRHLQTPTSTIDWRAVPHELDPGAHGFKLKHNGAQPDCARAQRKRWQVKHSPTRTHTLQVSFQLRSGGASAHAWLLLVENILDLFFK